MNSLNSKSIEIIPAAFKEGTIGEEIFGYDIGFVKEDATLEDYVGALNDFTQKHLAPCMGCDGCCHERAPLVATDIYLLKNLLPPSEYPAHDVVHNFAELLIFPDGAADIILKREPSGACIFLAESDKYCRNHHVRPLTCRSFFCLNKSVKAEALRNAIINAGEDQLVHLLWREEENGAPPLLKDKINILDYPENGFKDKKTTADILIKEVVPQELWQKIQP